MANPTLPVKLAPGTALPAYSHPDDAAFDLALSIPEPITLQPGETTEFLSLGFAMALPEGYFGLAVPRSSMAKRGLMMANTVGIIDNGYRGDMKTKLHNYGQEAQTLTPGERVLQLVLLPYVQATLVPVETLPETARGEGGFGSTNK